MSASSMNTKAFKEFARQQGADLIGISPPSRWQDIRAEENPLSIFPEAKSIITLAMRAPRGCFRGIEEGTYWASYAQNGYGNINLTWMPTLLRSLALALEDKGWEAVPVTHQFPGGSRGGVAGRRVRPNQPAPDIWINFRQAALLCGLGEYGYSKVFLTKDFGPRQRFGVLITEAELESDNVPEPSICDKCKACVKDCPGAISGSEEVVKEFSEGRASWGKLDVAKCTYCHHGMNPVASPFIDKEPDWPAIDSDDDREIYCRAKYEISDPIRKNPKIMPYIAGSPSMGPGLLKTFPYHGAICGGRGCIRACMIHLEKTKRIKNVFHNEFRKRPLW